MTAKTAKTVPAKPNMTTYLLNMQDGTRQKITCPTDWTVTFGPLTPGSKDGNNGHRGIALRIRDGVRQKAVFTGVESFRDTSMEIEVELVKTKEEVFFREEDGERKQVIVNGSIKEWANPDAPGQREAPRSNMPQVLNALPLEIRRG
jgi:hypothetical protein